MNTKELICITCPIGCMLKVQLKDDQVIKVTGNACPRGIAYAKAECLNPTRMLTTSIIIEEDKMLSVKTSEPIPKTMIGKVNTEIEKTNISAPVHIGDVVIADVLGLGVDIVATRNVE